MDYESELFELVSKLSKAEISFINRHLLSLKLGELSKKYELFELLTTSAYSNDDEISTILYKSKPSSKYYMLKKSLFEVITDCLILKNTTDFSESPRHQASVMCHKYLLKSSILAYKGCYVSLKHCLVKGIAIADDFDLLQEKCLFLEWYRTYLSYREGLSSYMDYSEVLRNTLVEVNMNTELRTYYNELAIRSAFQNVDDSRYQGYLAKMFEKVNCTLSDINSPNTHFYYLYLRIFYECSRYKYEDALGYAIQFKELIEQNKSVRTASRIGASNLQLSYIYIQLWQFDRALEYAQSAIDKFRNGYMNQLQAFELFFISALNLRDISKMKIVVDKALVHPKLLKQEALHEKWLLYSAVLKYCCDDRENAMKILMKLKELLKDREGWYLSVLYMEILILISDELYEIAGLRLKTIRQIVKNQNDKYLSNTNIVVSNIQKFLNLSSKTHTSMPDYDFDVRWNPMSFEIINHLSVIKKNA